LRAIKAANAGGNHELNQAGPNNSWFGKNQAEINAAAVNMTADQIAALKAYEEARDAVTNHGNTDTEKVAMRLVADRLNHNDFNTVGGDGLFTKLVNQANVLA
jgi:hypothetical protein